MSADPLLSREAFIEGLVRMGVPRERAEAEADRQLGPARTAIQLERDEQALEKQEQWEVVKLYRGFGCTVRTLSQPRATKQSPGFPDLWVTCARIAHAWWHETKRQGLGEDGLRPDQVVFREDCLACGIDHVVGDRFAAGEQLVRLGLATRNPDGSLEPTRDPEAAMR